MVEEKAEIISSEDYRVDPETSWFGFGGEDVYIGLVRVARECWASRSVFWYPTCKSVTWLLTLYLTA